MPLKWKRTTFKTHRKTGLWWEEKGYTDHLNLFGIHQTSKGSWILTMIANGRLILSLSLLKSAKDLAEEMFGRWGPEALSQSEHPLERLREMSVLVRSYLLK
jgi:hypothetical protein